MRVRRYLILLLLLTVMIVPACILLPMKAEADIGPKPSITLTVVNGPEEYYVALLYYSSSKGNNFHPDDASDITDYELFFRMYELDGWRVFFNPVGQNMYKKNKKGSYYFNYMVPDPFRVLIVTPDKTTYISNILDQTEFNANCTYDVATGELTEQLYPSVLDEISSGKVTVIVSPWYVIFCYVMTLIIEAIVLKLFGYPFTRRNLICFLVINTITNLSYAIYTVNSVSGWNFFLRCVVFEIGIAFTEAVFYAFMLRDRKGKRNAEKSFTYGITANIVSAALGILGIMIYSAIRWLQLL